MKTAATPTATAARASTGTKRRSPPDGVALPARLLHRVGGVEHHRIAGLGQDRQRPHVVDQRVVAEADAALAQQDVVVAGAGDLRRHVLHVPGRQELALLDVDRAAGRGRGEQQIGLAAEKGGDLQHVDRFGDRARIARPYARRSAPGSHRSRAPRRGSGRLASRPRPRAPSIEVRFALSKEVL